MCFPLHKLDFHLWKVEPSTSNSQTKRAASFRPIGRRIRYVNVFEVPTIKRVCHWNAKLNFIIALYLLMFLKSTQGCKKPSKTRAKSKCSDIMSEHIAILVGHLQHFGRTMSDSSFQHCKLLYLGSISDTILDISLVVRFCFCC